MSRSHLILFILLFVLVLLPGNSAGLDKWVRDNSSLAFEHEVFSLSAGEGRDMIVLRSNDSSRSPVVLKINQSLESQGLSFLFDGVRNTNAKYYEKNNLTGIHNGEGEVYEYHLAITRPEPKITITRSLSSKELSPMDIFNLSVSIRNTGDKDIIGDYSEDISVFYRTMGRLSYRPGGGDLREYYGYSRPGYIDWEGMVKPGQTVVLVQELQLAGASQGSDEIPFNNGFFTYSYLGKNYSVESDELSPHYDYPLHAVMSISSKSMKVDDEGSATLTLTNTGDFKMSVNSLELQVPANIAIDSSDLDYSKTCGCYQWDGSLEAQETKEMALHFTVMRTGDINVSAAIDSTYLTFHKLVTAEKSVPSGIDLPQIAFDVPGKVDSNGEYDIGFSFDNDKSSYDFHSLGINITSELFDNQQYIFTYLGKGAEASKSFSSKAPFVRSDMYFPVNLSYSFRSSHDEVFSAVMQKKILVKKIDFVPDLGLGLKGYSVNSSSNSSYPDLLSTWLNLSRLTNRSVGSAEVRLGFLGEVRYFAFGKDDLEKNTFSFDSGFTVPKNLSTEKGEIDALLTYSFGEDTYMLEYSYPVSLSTGKGKASEGKPEAKATSSSDVDYPADEGDSGFHFGFDIRMMIISLFVILFVFVMVVLFFFVAKSRKKKEEGHEKFFSVLEVMQEEDAGGNSQGHWPVGGRGGFGRHNKMADSTVPLPSTELGPLEDYIKASRDKKLSEEKIKKALVSNGWLEDVIEVFLK